MEIGNNETESNELFIRFNGTGRSPLIIGFTGARMLMALICILLNATVFYVTIKRKNLREIFNILIAWNSLVCLFYMLTYFNQFLVGITGWNFVPIRQCFLLMLLPIFASQSLHLSYLVISLDRLICVIFPIWHRNVLQANSISYLFALIGSVSLYSLIGLLSGIPYSLWNDPNRLVTCSTGDGVPSVVFQLTFYYNIVSLLVYLLLLAIVRLRKGEEIGEAKKKVQNSLMIIFLVEFAGNFSNNLVKQLISWMQCSVYDQWLIMNIAGLFLVPTLAMNAPVLYIRNMEYARAFYKAFGFRFPFSRAIVVSANWTNKNFAWTTSRANNNKNKNPNQISN